MKEFINESPEMISDDEILEVYRVRAPFRISFAGGGTDLPSWFRNHGGRIISTTIDRFIYVTLYKTTRNDIIIDAIDLNMSYTINMDEGADDDSDIADSYNFTYNDNFDYVKAILKFFRVKTGCFIRIHSDLPAKSGMGTSSSLMVALIKVFADLKGIEMTKEEIAQLACFLERVELNQAGGYQDQYAAAFGGLNFIEFGNADTDSSLPSISSSNTINKDSGNIQNTQNIERLDQEMYREFCKFRQTLNIKVKPLNLRRDFLLEFNYRMLLCFTGKTHISSELQKMLIKNYGTLEFNSGMEKLKKVAKSIYSLLDQQDINELPQFGKLLHEGWIAKKQTSKKVSNENIEKLYLSALNKGALGGKILGAGSGGFLFLFIDPQKRFEIIKILEEMGGVIYNFKMENEGVLSWKAF